MTGVEKYLDIRKSLAKSGRVEESYGEKTLSRDCYRWR